MPVGETGLGIFSVLLTIPSVSWICAILSPVKARTVAGAGESRARIYKEGYLTVPPKNTAECWVGIDVSKGWIDVFVLLEEKKAESFRCNRTGPALAELAKKLLPYDPQGIILEATGGLEVPVIAALDAVGLKVMRMNPKRVRDFASGMGFLGKPKQVALIAVARKLLIALNEMVRTNTAWRVPQVPIPA